MPTNHTVDVFSGAPGSAGGWAGGDPVTAESYVIVDGDDDGELEVGDTIDGETILSLSDGLNVDFAAVSGVDGVFIQTPTRSLFIPTDGTSPVDTTFSTYNTGPTTDYSATISTMCFAAGTLIACPQGEVPVETLSIGDLVLSADGVEVPVKWIGRQTVMAIFGPADRLMPVRFSAGALGLGLPHSDLTVTADHGMLVADVICHAGALVNGTDIIRVPLADLGGIYTVYHIETEAHEIILANGAPAETFIDNVSRRAFDNFAEFDALYGDVPEMVELPYPRAMSARQVPERISHQIALRRRA